MGLLFKDFCIKSLYYINYIFTGYDYIIPVAFILKSILELAFSFLNTKFLAQINSTNIPFQKSWF